MLEIRKSSERGRSRYDWLDSRHSFSFGSYYDASNLGFRALRVINEDWIAPGAGFGPHPHRDMEILTYVIDGELSHRDGEGNASTLAHGRVQLMSAGRGIVHSEVNPNSEHPLHLLQIWIEPDERGLAPSYQEASIDLAPAELRPIATPRGEKGGLAIHQSTSVYALALEPGQSFEYTLNDGRYAWVQAASGSGSLEEMALEAGDVAVLRDEGGFSLSTNAGIEVLVFDLS